MSQYSLVHLTNAACPPPEFVRIAAAAGYDCVSFRGIPTRSGGQGASQRVSEKNTGKMPFDFAHDPRLIRDTRQAAEDAGIILHDTENARIFDGGDVKLYQADLEAAAELGIHHILTNIWADDPAFCQEQFEELCDLGAEYGLSVNLEFVTWSAVKDLRGAAAMVRKAARPNAGIVVDALHVYRSRVDISELAELPPDWFRYMHLCDCPAAIPEDPAELIRTGIDERLFPGEGAVDIPGIVGALPRAVRGLEIPNSARMASLGFEEYVRRALASTKKVLSDY